MGLFEYTRMPMGLSSAPATFQRVMQSTMSDFIFQFLLVYLDDLLVCLKTFDKHLDRLDRLLQRIIDAGLKLRLDKCQFLRRQVHYLGHAISAERCELQGRKGEGCKELAGADHYCLSGLRQLLPALYPGLLQDRWSSP